MLRVNKIAKATIVAVIALSATPSAGNVSNTIHLRAHVPVYCNVELLPSLGSGLAERVVNLGMTQEFCNSPRGYRIILQHPADLPGAAVISDSVRIPLSESGETVLSDSDHAGFRFRHVALDVGEEGTPINRIHLRIEVKY